MMRSLAVCLLLGVGACGMPSLNVKFVEPNIAQFKARGNRVVVGEGSLVSDVLAIEVMKNGKFVIAGHELPKEQAKVALSDREITPARSNALAAPAEAAAAAPPSPSAEAPEGPAAKPSVASEGAPQGGEFDYVFSVNTSTKLYAPSSNSYPATYSFSVTAKTGEIVYIKALSGGDLKAELSTTLSEVAGLLL